MFALTLVVGYIKRLFTTYTISNHRLHIRRGIIARREQQTQINRVQNVNTDQGVIERVLQIGTVDFDTAAGDDYQFKFAGVADPRGSRRGGAPRAARGGRGGGWTDRVE